MGLIGPLLALGSAVTWGVADFAGGMLSRRLPSAAVVGVSQACSLVLLLLVLPLIPAAGDWGWVPWSILAGLAGSAALICFYRALAYGTVGVVSPISALGASIPVLAGLLGGENPGPVRLAGIAVALTGAVLASGPELRGEQPVKAQAIWFAVAAAGGFGLTMLAITRGAASSPMLTMVGMRSASVVAFGIAALALRSVGGVTGRDLPKLALLGVGDVTANALLGFASTVGLLSVTAVLSALYPVVTVALAAVILHERMKPVQVVGVVLAFVGVGLIAGG
ncbi:MAG TPA: DMT family transporter [Micropruina sp.]|nr:DMT family transporter [Micropruina sp.]